MAPNTSSNTAPPDPRDVFGRPAHDLRISVTDRCNLRCTYCMPEERFNENHAFLQRSELLTFEEIARIGRASAQLGVRKLRLTGGEPLLRRDLPVLVEMLRRIEAIEDIALTTNGLLLPSTAHALYKAGVNRVTISLDSLDDTTLARIAGRPIRAAQVLAGIDAARSAGFSHIKVNAVIQRGLNDSEILPLAKHFRGTGVTLRFIEYMDVGTLNDWQDNAVITAAEILDRIAGEFPLEPLSPNYAGEVATRYRYKDGQGELGIIASVSQPFCGGCTRLRLSADGDLYTCLFAAQGHPVKPLLRAGVSDADLEEHLRSLWQARDDRYSELRGSMREARQKVEMYHIGG